MQFLKINYTDPTRFNEDVAERRLRCTGHILHTQDERHNKRALKLSPLNKKEEKDEEHLGAAQ